MKLSDPNSTTEPQTSLPSANEIREQLERVVQSSHFRNSRRYPTLLRYIVEHTVAGDEGSLKERTLGVEVFGRAPDYDTNADPVVRVTAGEIRKRIAQYYQAPGHESELRFELPLGSYIPQFVRSGAAVSAPGSAGSDVLAEPNSTALVPALLDESTPSRRRRARLLFARRSTPATRLIAAVSLFLLLAAAVGAVVIGRQHPQQESEGIAYFWGALLGTQDPALIVLGLNALDTPLRYAAPNESLQTPPEQESSAPPIGRTDMVPIEDVVSYGRLVSLLAEHNHTYTTQGAVDTTFDQLRRGPVILVGSFNNIWVMRLTAGLRFRFSGDANGTQSIEDSEHPGTLWQRDIAPDALSYRDYAVVGCFFDPRIEHYVLFASGIGRSGTAAAAEFLTNDKYLREWVARTHPDLRHNVEIVLSTEIIDGKHGPPHVVASHVW